MIIINTGIILFLLLVIYQDFRYRAIAWMLFPAGFLLCIGRYVFLFKQNDIIKYFLLNILFISIQFICLSVYYSIKEKKIVNIFIKKIGIGDLLFLILIAMCFSPLNYIVFTLFSFFVITIIFGFLSLIRKKKVLVPLTGSVAIVFLSIFVLNWMLPKIDMYNDLMVMKMLQTWI